MLELLGIVGSIATSLAGLYQRRLDAETDQERAEIDAMIADIKEHQATQRAAMLHWWTALPMITMAMAVAFYVCKVIVWDSCPGLGSTPVIRGAVGEWMGQIVMSTFGVGGVALSAFIASRFARR
jgi:hypothetical protein